MQEEESSYEIHSIRDSKERPQSERWENSMNFSQMIKSQLKDYDDVDDDDFIMVDAESEAQTQNKEGLNTTQNSMHYMHYHSTMVPIGANYQAIIPSILTEAAYKVKSRNKLTSLQFLKVHNPSEAQQFYTKYFCQIEDSVGPGRSYEDINKIRNSFHRVMDSSKFVFEDYLQKYQVYWQEQFRIKDKHLLNKSMPKKKRRNKGTIPV